jgi:hypothetical protein
MTQFILNETPRGQTRDGAKLVLVKMPKPKRERRERQPRRKFNVGDTATFNVKGHMRQYTKVAERTGHFRSDWRPTSELVWEQHYGAIPDGKKLYHVNGNTTDDRIENLAAGTIADIVLNWRQRKPDNWQVSKAKSLRACSRALRAKEIARKVLGFMPEMFYPVDHTKHEILNVPCHDKIDVYEAVGFDREEMAAGMPKYHRGRRAAAAALGWPGMSVAEACVLVVMEGRGWCHHGDVLDKVRKVEMVRTGSWPGSVHALRKVFDKARQRGYLERRRNGKHVEWRLPPHLASQRRSWTNVVPMQGKHAARLFYRRVDPRFGDVTNPTESVLWRVLRTVRAEAKASTEKP